MRVHISEVLRSVVVGISNNDERLLAHREKLPVCSAVCLKCVKYVLGTYGMLLSNDLKLYMKACTLLKVLKHTRGAYMRKIVVQRMTFGVLEIF